MGCVEADGLAAAMEEARQGRRDGVAQLRIDMSDEVRARLRVADDERSSDAEEHLAEEAAAQRREIR